MSGGLLFDTINEFDAANDLWDLLVTVQPTSAFLSSLGEFEHYHWARFSTAVGFRLAVPRVQRCKSCFDRVGGSQVRPVLCLVIVKRQ